MPFVFLLATFPGLWSFFLQMCEPYQFTFKIVWSFFCNDYSVRKPLSSNRINGQFYSSKVKNIGKKPCKVVVKKYTGDPNYLSTYNSTELFQKSDMQFKIRSRVSFHTGGGDSLLERPVSTKTTPPPESTAQGFADMLLENVTKRTKHG